MMLRVSVQKPSDHALVLSVVPSRLGLEEIHTAFAQRNSDLDPLVPEDEILGAREKVRNDSWVSERFVRDRKSTRLNSSHSQISYAVFCLKKKKKNIV